MSVNVTKPAMPPLTEEEKTNAANLFKAGLLHLLREHECEYQAASTSVLVTGFTNSDIAKYEPRRVTRVTVEPSGVILHMPGRTSEYRLYEQPHRPGECVVLRHDHARRIAPLPPEALCLDDAQRMVSWLESIMPRLGGEAA